ncbi:MAG: acyl-CoA dehydrogenase family protein [Acidimicrobiia bacterium]
MLVALSYERGVAGGVRDAERLLVNAEAYARDTLDADGRPLVEQPVKRGAGETRGRRRGRPTTSSPGSAWVSGSGRLPGTEGAHVKLFATRSRHPRRQRVHGPRRARGSLEQGRPARRPRSRVRVLLPVLAPVATAAPGEISANLVAQRPRPPHRGRQVRDPLFAPEHDEFGRVPRSARGDGPGSHRRPPQPRPHRPRRRVRRAVLRHLAGAAGFLGISLPEEEARWQRQCRVGTVVVSYESAYHDGPLIDTAAHFLGPTVLTFGTPEQLDRIIRPAIAGEINRCIARHRGAGGQRPHRWPPSRRPTATRSSSPARRCS